MPTLDVTARNGERHAIDAVADGTVMEALRDSGVTDLVAMCGGCCACATCHVYVDDAWLDRVGPTSEGEREMMDELAYRQPNSRLSCQIVVREDLDGMLVTVVPEE